LTSTTVITISWNPFPSACRSKLGSLISELIEPWDVVF
jgi:hypothetical protein